MRVNSVSSNNINKTFKANPTGVAKNCKQAIKKMNTYAGTSIGLGVLGSVSLLTGFSLLAGFATLIPMYFLMKQFDKESNKYDSLKSSYNSIKQRAKNIYG